MRLVVKFPSWSRWASRAFRPAAKLFTDCASSVVCGAKEAATCSTLSMVAPRASRLVSSAFEAPDMASNRCCSVSGCPPQASSNVSIMRLKLSAVTWLTS